MLTGLPRRSTSRLRMPTLRGADSVNAHLPKDGDAVDVGATGPWPGAEQGTAVQLRTEKGELLTIEDQVQLYCPNNLVQHPLVSPALSYLGGLPPLFFVISDKEVLRDEGIYTYVQSMIREFADNDVTDIVRTKRQNRTSIR